MRDRCLVFLRETTGPTEPDAKKIAPFVRPNRACTSYTVRAVWILLGSCFVAPLWASVPPPLLNINERKRPSPGLAPRVEF